MEKDIADQLLVTTFKLEKSLWDGDRDTFQEALTKEIEYGSKDILVYALEQFDKRQGA